MKNKMRKWVNIITMAVSSILVIVLLVSAIFKAEKMAIVIESISLTLSFTVNFTLNAYFIRRVERIEIEKANLIKVAEANGLFIDKTNLVNIEKIVSNSFINYDDKIMQAVMDLMDEFECEINNGGFTIYGPFNLDVLEGPECLMGKIGTEKFTCRDDKINDYLLKLQAKLQVMSNNLIFHSFSTPTVGINKMRWIEMGEEQALGKTFNQDRLASEKKAFDETEAAIKDSISIYKEMINYWRNSRKIAE